MRITDLLKACSVELNGTPQTKEETIKDGSPDGKGR